jgi:hypothetical protein
VAATGGVPDYCDEKRMSKHPFRNAFKCHLWQEGQPCLCPAWLSVVQEHDSSTGEPSRHVAGCAFQLLPWLLTGPIVKSSQVLGEVAGMRRDVQQVQREVVGGLNRIGAAVVGGLSRLTAAGEGRLLGGNGGGENQVSGGAESHLLAVHQYGGGHDFAGREGLAGRQDLGLDAAPEAVDAAGGAEVEVRCREGRPAAEVCGAGVDGGDVDYLAVQVEGGGLRGAGRQGDGDGKDGREDGVAHV